MDNKTFTAKSIEFSLGIRFHDWLTAIMRRKDTIKTFCRDVNIDYPIDETKKYHFPSKYFVEAEEINYLAKNRDKIILALYEDYKEAQKAVNIEKNKLENNRKTELGFLEELRDERDKLVNERKNEKNSVTKLTLEAKINNKKTQIKNCEGTINEIQSQIKDDEILFSNNIKSWHNQVSIVCATFSTQTNKYILSATKKIRTKLNFTDFYFYPPEHSKDVKEILEG